MPAFWQDLGGGKPVFTAKGMGDTRGVRFVDVNGEQVTAARLLPV